MAGQPREWGHRGLPPGQTLLDHAAPMCQVVPVGGAQAVVEHVAGQQRQLGRQPLRLGEGVGRALVHAHRSPGLGARHVRPGLLLRATGHRGAIDLLELLQGFPGPPGLFLAVIDGAARRKGRRGRRGHCLRRPREQSLARLPRLGHAGLQLQGLVEGLHRLRDLTQALQGDAAPEMRHRIGRLQPQTLVVGRHGLGSPPERQQQAAAVVVGERMVGAQLQRPVDQLEPLLEPALLAQRRAQQVQRVEMSGLLRQHALVASHRLRQLPQLVMRQRFPEQHFRRPRSVQDAHPCPLHGCARKKTRGHGMARRASG